MALWVPSAAAETWLDIVLATGITLKLYKTDVTAGLNTAQIKALTEASFTEATFTGYSAKTLTGGSWVTTAGDPGTATYAQQTFTSTANQTAQTIYGYYLVRTSDGKLLGFERFTGSVTISLLNDAIVTTPTITLDDDQEATVAARGVVGTPYTSTSSTSSYVAADSNTDMTLTYTTDATRIYRIHLHAAWNINGPGVWHVFATVNGTDTVRIGMINSDGTIKDGVISSSALWYPTSASQTVLITVNNFSGISTMFFYAASDTPRQLWIEDCGPR